MAVWPVTVPPDETAPETGPETADRTRDRSPGRSPEPAAGRDRPAGAGETGTRRTAAARRAVAAQLTGRTNRLFYVVVLLVALYGSASAAQSWLIGSELPAGTPGTRWHFAVALVAVAVYELGAVAVSRFADQRRQLGERAVVARLVSAALAGGAIAGQYLGHPHRGQAVFFAGVSAVGYAVYLLEAAANRRDALRDEGKLADTPPAYGLLQWVGHPGITARARRLALANAEARLTDDTLPALGRVASLAAAATQVRAEKRLDAIGAALSTRIAEGVDPTMAQIAVNTYDLARVADGIAADADYPALTRIITAELVPARLIKIDPAGSATTGETAPVPPPAPLDQTGPAPAETETRPVPPAETVRRRPALEVVPAGAQLLTLAPLRAPETAPVPTETAPVPPPADVPNPATPDPAATAPDLGGTDETDTETGPDPLAGIAVRLLPHMRAVIDAHQDWAVAIKMPPRHPDALTTAKILTAAGCTGKQLGCDIRTALLGLADTPETAEHALRSRGLAPAAAN